MYTTQPFKYLDPSAETAASSGAKARGPERRLLLVQATLRLIADEGIDAVSHRAVAELADVPLGSTTYWFASRRDMLRQALEHFVRTEIEPFGNGWRGCSASRASPADAWSTSSRPSCCRSWARSGGVRPRSTRSSKRLCASPTFSPYAESGRRPGRPC